MGRSGTAATNVSLYASYACCERMTRIRAGNFYPAFRILPAEQRRAMCALYAFMRIADDIADGPGDVSRRVRDLDQWRQDALLALDGQFRHRIHPALRDTVQRFAIPADYLELLLDGVAMDLAPAAFPTFEELRRYCFHVASVVGLACIQVWGYTARQARDYAISAGIAFQLTNILRDVGEDVARGRIYLPQEDLERFGYGADQLRLGERAPAFYRLMRYQAERARAFYQAAEPLRELLSPAGRAVYHVLSGTYRALLDAIERSGFDVFGRRIGVPWWRKVWQVVGAVPLRLGWGL